MKVNVAKTSSGSNPSEWPARFDALFEAHHGEIYRYCLRRLGATDAEDAAADVFAVAWRRIDEMPSGEISRAWLFGVAYRVIGNRYRFRARQRNLSVRLQTVQSNETDPLQHDPTNQIGQLYRALDKIPNTDRELLKLAAWDGLTRSEIAAMLSITDNAVDQRLHRARRRLRNAYERLESSRSHPTPTEAST